jgi:hypothetical protein
VVVQRALAILALIVLGGSAIADMDVVAPFVAGNPDEPGWRRTSQGWVKVGQLGDAAFMRPNRTPITRGALHPVLLSALVTLASLVALIAHEGVAHTASPPTSDDAGARDRLQPHFDRKLVIR